MKKMIVVLLIPFLFLFLVGVDKHGKDEDIKYEVNVFDSYLTFENKLNKINNEKIEEVIKRPYISDLPFDDDFLDYVWKKSTENGFSYELMLAFAMQESNLGKYTYNKNKNGTYDGGVWQINSRNIDWLSELADIKSPDVNNPYHNFDMALSYLIHLRDYWRNIDISEEQRFFAIVLSYNKGIQGATDWIKKYGWNSKYVDNVLKYKEEFEQKAVYDYEV